MFLAQIVFSFRSLCLKTFVIDFVLPGTRGEEERGDGGLLVRGGWMRRNGQCTISGSKTLTNLNKLTL